MALYKHRIEREIKKRDDILFALSSAVEWLLRVTRSTTPATRPDEFITPTDMQNILDPLGLALDAGSIGIFQLTRDPSGKSAISMIYEWGCQGYHSCLFKPELKGFTYGAMGLHRWEDLLNRGEVVSAAPGALPDEEKPLFSLLGVESGVIVPVFVRDSLWGFIGFVDVKARTRSPDEIEALRITANLLGAAMGYR
jgi:GAF domain-containing protein